MEGVYFITRKRPPAEDIQDMSIVKSILKQYRGLNNTPFFIRSTVLPKTCDHLAKFFRMRIYSMPEFLTERESDACVAKQNIICGVSRPEEIDDQLKLVSKIFPDKEILIMANREAELAKYAHNVMGAIKVNFFNLVAKYAEDIRANYEAVIDGVCMTGYINRTHTMVPGPDSKHGFGGKCFPPNIIIFLAELKRLGLQYGSIECTLFENVLYRCAWERDFKQPVITYPSELRQLIGESK
jgi:UDPglucose 6-dehydrogenase